MKKKIVIAGAVFIGLLILYNLVHASWLIYKGAFEASILSLFVAVANIGWLTAYFNEMQNIDLQNIIDTQHEIIEFSDKIRSELLEARFSDLSVFNQRIDATVEEVEKIIELSQKRMVNGLPEERYTCFINEVLHAINGFAEHAKHNLRNRNFEPNEKLVKTMTKLKTLAYEVKNDNN